MSTQHKITAVRSGFTNGMDWEAEYVVTFSYVPGAPDTYDAARGGPGGWDPGYPAEVEFISVEPLLGKLDVGAFTDLAQAELDDWAREWLDENYSAAVAEADERSQPDPDAARDARIDDELTGHARHDDGGDW